MSPNVAYLCENTILGVLFDFDDDLLSECFSNFFYCKDITNEQA